MCLKSNIDEGIHNLGFLCTTENPNYVFFLSIFCIYIFLFIFLLGGGGIFAKVCLK